MKIPMPQDRIKFRGHTLNRRTKRAFLWAEKRAGFTLPIAQGSYNTGVAASAGTHDGGGAVDVGVAGWDTAKRNRALNKLKNAGFAAWYRPPIAGLWGPHIHAILIGDKDLAWLAADQVRKYDQGRDGLASSNPDGSHRPVNGRKWSWILNRPVTRFK